MIIYFKDHSIFISTFPSVAFFTEYSNPSSSCSNGIYFNVFELSYFIKFWLYSYLTFALVSGDAFPNHHVTRWNPVMFTPEKRTVLLVIVIGYFTKTPYIKYLDPGIERRSIKSLVTLPPPRAS